MSSSSWPFCKTQIQSHGSEGNRDLFVKWPDICKPRDFVPCFRAWKDPKAEILTAQTEGRKPIVFSSLKTCSNDEDTNLSGSEIRAVVSAKLHGTNGAVGLNRKGHAWIQSRSRILGPSADNCGFFAFAAPLVESGVFSRLANDQMVRLGIDPNTVDSVVFFGEWCGGSIQKGVALNRCPRHFAIFCVRINDRWTLPLFADEPEILVFNLHGLELPGTTSGGCLVGDDPSEWECMASALALECDQCCPWSLSRFGVDGTGEGVVVQLARLDGTLLDPRLWYKIKGESHLQSKRAVRAQTDSSAVDPTIPLQFVEATVNAARCNQALKDAAMHERNHCAHLRNQLTAQSLRNWRMKKFITLVLQDILKEEKDLIAASESEGFYFKFHIEPLIKKTAESFFDESEFNDDTEALEPPKEDEKTSEPGYAQSS